MKWDHDFPFFISQKRSRFSPPLNLGTPPKMWPDMSTTFEKIQLVRLFGTQRDLPLYYRIHAHGIFTCMNSLLLWQFIQYHSVMLWDGGCPCQNIIKIKIRSPEMTFRDHSNIYILYIFLHITCGNTASTVATCVKIAMPRFFFSQKHGSIWCAASPVSVHPGCNWITCKTLTVQNQTPGNFLIWMECKV